MSVLRLPWGPGREEGKRGLRSGKVWFLLRLRQTQGQTTTATAKPGATDEGTGSESSEAVTREHMGPRGAGQGGSGVCLRGSRAPSPERRAANPRQCLGA